jgi:hypothetical protein
MSLYARGRNKGIDLGIDWRKCEAPQLDVLRLPEEWIVLERVIVIQIAGAAALVGERLMPDALEYRKQTVQYAGASGPWSPKRPLMVRVPMNPFAPSLRVSLCARQKLSGALQLLTSTPQFEYPSFI